MINLNTMYMIKLTKCVINFNPLIYLINSLSFPYCKIIMFLNSCLFLSTIVHNHLLLLLSSYKIINTKITILIFRINKYSKFVIVVIQDHLKTSFKTLLIMIFSFMNALIMMIKYSKLFRISILLFLK